MGTAEQSKILTGLGKKASSEAVRSTSTEDMAVNLCHPHRQAKNIQGNAVVMPIFFANLLFLIASVIV